MDQTNVRRATAQKSIMPNLVPEEFTQMGTERVQALTDLQKEFTDALAQANRDWVDRAKLESELASELMANMTTARTLPEATSAYQQWMGRRMEMLTADTQRFVADSQKMLGLTMRLVFGGAGGRK
jgi:hypothetical protein